MNCPSSIQLGCAPNRASRLAPSIRLDIEPVVSRTKSSGAGLFGSSLRTVLVVSRGRQQAGRGAGVHGALSRGRECSSVSRSCRLAGNLASPSRRRSVSYFRPDRCGHPSQAPRSVDLTNVPLAVFIPRPPRSCRRPAPLRCGPGRAGGPLASITEPEPVPKIVTHLGEPLEPAPPCARPVPSACPATPPAFALRPARQRTRLTRSAAGRRGQPTQVS